MYNIINHLLLLQEALTNTASTGMGSFHLTGERLLGDKWNLVRHSYVASVLVKESIYHQLNSHLRQLIASGECPAGSKSLLLRSQPPHCQQGSIELGFRGLAGIPQGCRHILDDKAGLYGGIALALQGGLL